MEQKIYHWFSCISTGKMTCSLQCPFWGISTQLQKNTNNHPFTPCEKTIGLHTQETCKPSAVFCLHGSAISFLRGFPLSLLNTYRKKPTRIATKAAADEDVDAPGHESFKLGSSNPSRHQADELHPGKLT